MRKIIQPFVYGEDCRTVLCDDGTVWDFCGPRGWMMMEPIPQDKPDGVFVDSIQQAPKPTPPQDWMPKGLEADLWTMVDCKVTKIVGPNLLRGTLAIGETIVEAYHESDAKRMLLDPDYRPDTDIFEFEGVKYTIPADLVPF